MRTHLITCTGALIGSLLLFGCTLLPSSEGDHSVDIRTDATEYAALPSTTIQLTVTNRSDAPIYYQCTGQIYLEERIDGQRTNRWMVHGFARCLTPQPIASNASVTFDLSSAIGNSLDESDTAQTDEHVQYRLFVDLYADDTFDELLPPGQRYSNRFTISPR